MSSSVPPKLPESLQPVENLPKLLCGFPLAELLHAMPPAAPATSANLTKPDHLDQNAINKLMSPDESPPVVPFSTSPERR